MTRSQKKKAYLLLVLLVFLVFCVGVFAGYLQRNDKLCPDGRPPIAQQVDATIGQTEYLCHDGTTVTESS